MKLLLHPPVEPERLARIGAAAEGLVVVNAADEAEGYIHQNQQRPLRSSTLAPKIKSMQCSPLAGNADRLNRAFEKGKRLQPAIVEKLPRRQEARWIFGPVDEIGGAVVVVLCP